MKLSNISFLSKANIKGNTKSKGLIALVSILVISITIFASYGVTITKSVNEFKQDYLARSVEITPFNKELDDKTLESVKKLDHVYDIYDCKPFTSEAFDICSIESKTVDQKMFFLAHPLIGDEKKM